MTCTRCAHEIEPDSVYCRFCGATVAAAADRKLTRLPDAGRIAGVCAGLAAYLNTDVTLVRVAWAVLSLVPGAIIGGIIAYAAAWLLLPASAVPPLPAAAGRRLVRPFAGRKIGGVCAGLAQYLAVDTTVVRLTWVILSIYPGAVICGVAVYAAAWFIIPSEAGGRLDPVSSAA